MTNSGPEVSDRVKNIYDDIGWKEVDGGVTYDAKMSEDLRPVASAYVTETRKRVLRHLPKTGDRLMDMASGPIQYPEYLEFSKGFNTRVCVDLSQRALDMARVKIGDHGEYLCGDFLDLKIPSNSVDAVVSLHTVYHIHSSLQPMAVRKMLDVVKPEGNVVIVYSNPNNIVSLALAPFRRILGRINSQEGTTPETIYFQPQPLSWWKQFDDIAKVKIYPWRSLSTPVQKALIHSGLFGQRILHALFKLEDRYPAFFVKYGVYPMIVLTKR